ncbi:hypothetical protein SPARK1531C2_05468 [Klebsiella grimontii]|nr:hypothetical protein SPARK1531C2_05468 [Klebsiella grimontii]
MFKITDITTVMRIRTNRDESPGISNCPDYSSTIIRTSFSGSGRTTIDFECNVMMGRSFCNYFIINRIIRISGMRNNANEWIADNL